MMSLTFGLFTQASDFGPHGHLVRNFLQLIFESYMYRARYIYKKYISSLNEKVVSFILFLLFIFFFDNAKY